MSGLAVTALVLVSVWLGVLTLVVVLLVRQIGLLTIRLSVAGHMRPSDDGPEVGSDVPEEITVALPDLEDQRAYVLLISASCLPCRELVANIANHRFEQTIIALMPGRDELADELVALLPPGIQVVRDPQATALADVLNIQSTPFVLEVEGGRIIRKAYLYDGAKDLAEFVGSEWGVRAPTKSSVEVVRNEESMGR